MHIFKVSVFIAAANLSDDDKVAATKSIVKQMPNDNYRTLKALIDFLRDVVKHSDRNLMTPNNLAIVFGPNLTWSHNQQVSLLHLRDLNQFAYRLLVSADAIFDR